MAHSPVLSIRDLTEITGISKSIIDNRLRRTNNIPAPVPIIFVPKACFNYKNNIKIRFYDRKALLEWHKQWELCEKQKG